MLLTGVYLKQAYGMVRTTTGPLSGLPSLPSKIPAANVPEPDEEVEFMNTIRSHFGTCAVRKVCVYDVLRCWGYSMLLPGFY